MISILRTAAPAGLRSAKHLAMEDSFERVLQDKKLGFVQLPERHELQAKIVAEGERLRQSCSQILFFGVGGSALGPQLIDELYSTSMNTVGMVDNLDPHYLSRVISTVVDFERTGFIIVSKSGGTLETLAALQYFQEKHFGATKNWASRCLVISEERESALTNWARKFGVNQIEVPLDVGGRFSVLSPVGLVLAEYLGASSGEILAGAAWAKTQKDLVVELMDQSAQSFERDEWITLFWNYSSSLRSFGGWLVQLWAESLAKKTRIDGEPAPRVSTPIAALGANDQHSILQQVMEGANDKHVIFHRVKSLEEGMRLSEESLFPELSEIAGKTLGGILNIEAISTAEALRRQDVSVMELEVQDLSPKTMGALFMLWMLVVASMGDSLGINAFDQPGVELGKRLAKGLLKNGVLP